jgi:hypothetical protein
MPSLQYGRVDQAGVAAAVTRRTSDPNVSLVRFKLDGQQVETLDSVRYRAVVAYIDGLGSEDEWPNIRSIGQGGEVDGLALIEELDRLGHRGVPDDIAQMLGNIWNDVARALRAQGKLPPTE